MQEKNVKQETKNAIWNILGATFNAFNSFLFAIIVTRINGINDAGIFTYSFATACVLFVIALYLGRTFQVTDIGRKSSDSDYIYNRVFTCSIMILFSIFFCLVKKYDLYKSSIFVILCTFKAIEAFSESIYAIIQRGERLDQVGKSLTLKALFSVIVFFTINMITKNLIIASLSICIMNIIMLLFYDFRNVKKIGIVKTKYSNKSNYILLKVGFWTFLLTLMSQYIINASRYAIDDLLTNDLQTIFSIIIMPATFMGLLGQFIIQPILTSLTRYIKNKEYKLLEKTILKITGLIIFFGIITLLIVYFLGIPVLQFIYGVNLSEYFISLIIVIIGSILYSLELFFSTVLIVMRKTFGQAITYLIISVISTICAYILVAKLNILGACLSYFITMLLICISLCLYLIILLKLIKKKEKILLIEK